MARTFGGKTSADLSHSGGGQRGETGEGHVRRGRSQSARAHACAWDRQAAPCGERLPVDGWPDPSEEGGAEHDQNIVPSRFELLITQMARGGRGAGGGAGGVQMTTPQFRHASPQH